MKYTVFAALLAIFAASSPRAGEAQPTPGAPVDRLVSTKWLDDNIIRPEIVLVDVRPRETFEQGHIPGASWLDEARLVQRDGAAAVILPADEFKRLVESVGIGAGAHVIAIDDVGGRGAARLWWALGYYGFDDVSLLDGGYEKWCVEGRAQTSEYPFHRNAVFTPTARPERVATADAVRDWKKTHPAGVVIDARSSGEYEGRVLKFRRGGHVPGAINLAWDGAFDVHDDFRAFKSVPALQTWLTKSGISKDSQAVIYCLDGRRAVHLAFSMALAGLGTESVYLGSWLEWSGRSDLPVEAPKSPGGAPAKAAPGPTTPQAPPAARPKKP
ncbi:MAG TPA: rhodanese-like domain-containing protein [Verrucomicrobiae bacterium]|nr:rhodanese-like domain-containing protein [Verrucomicrobiae bacterium]